MKKQATKKKDSTKKAGKSKKVEDLKIRKKVTGGATQGTPKFGPFYSGGGI